MFDVTTIKSNSLLPGDHIVQLTEFTYSIEKNNYQLLVTDITNGDTQNIFFILDETEKTANVENDNGTKRTFTYSSSSISYSNIQKIVRAATNITALPITENETEFAAEISKKIVGLLVKVKAFEKDGYINFRNWAPLSESEKIMAQQLTKSSL